MQINGFGVVWPVPHLKRCKKMQKICFSLTFRRWPLIILGFDRLTLSPKPFAIIKKIVVLPICEKV